MIDILIPVYNGAATIRQSIASIQNQTLRDIRIVVVDDGSTDDTAAILADIAAVDPRVQVLRQENRGIVDALNAGLALCTADLVARHDGDDIAFADRLADQARYLENNPDCVAVASNAWHIDEHGTRMGTRTEFIGDVDPDPDRPPSREPYLMHPFLMVRRDALVAAGGYRYVFHSEDVDLYWRLLGKGRLHNLRTVHGEYRIHGGSVSSASIVNGRIASIYAQLAALSYKRVQAGSADLPFPREALDAYKAKGTMAAMIDLASAPLDSREAAWLRVAATAKLAELSNRRPYRLDRADYASIAAAWQENRRSLSPRHRKWLRIMLSNRLWDLVRKRRFDDARALATGSGLMPTLIGQRAKRLVKVALPGLRRAKGS